MSQPHPHCSESPEVPVMCKVGTLKPNKHVPCRHCEHARKVAAMSQEERAEYMQKQKQKAQDEQRQEELADILNSMRTAPRGTTRGYFPYGYDKHIQLTIKTNKDT